MALEVPDLDDREYEELLEDARRLLPVYTDEWTDHNASDPGITILELLAWLAESYTYELNRVTDDHVRKYLQLLGVQPAGPGRATVELDLSPPAAFDGTTVPAGTRVLADDRTGDAPTFETTREVTLTRASVERVVADHRAGRTDNSTANATQGMYFQGFGPHAARDSAMYLGFAGDPFVGDRLDIAFDFHDANLPEPAAHGDEEQVFEPDVELQWEYCRRYDEWFDDDAWQPLDLATDDSGDPLDETDRFYRGGVVTLARPPPDEWADARGTKTSETTVMGNPPELDWLRCRIEEAGHEIPPQFDRIAVNTVTARHSVTVGPIEGETADPLVRVDGPEEARTIRRAARIADEEVMTTDMPSQMFAFEHAPVLEAELGLRDPDDPGTMGEPWTEVPDFDASGPDDRHYVLDRTNGIVRFGDGRNGDVPPAGHEVVATRYVYGGGPAGNVPASTSWSFADEQYREVELAPRGAASGGTEAEPIGEALARLRERLDEPYRGVTAADYEHLAVTTPGLRFGRATATVVERPTPEGCPQHHGVRVVVVPFSTLPESRPPRPSGGFLEAVRSHLRRHRLVTDRVAVEPPTYVGVAVDVDVRIDAGYDAARRADAVGDALEAFLDPLAGFEGDGWPFGRPVYRSEVFEVVTGVEGIDCVLDLAMTAGEEGRRADDGSIEIPDTGLAYPEAPDVTVRTDRDRSGGKP